MNDSVWRVWIDTGGTFTDCIATRGGEVRRCKVLSSGRLLSRVLAAQGTSIEIEAIEGCVPGFLEGFQVQVTGLAAGATEAGTVIEHTQVSGAVHRLRVSTSLDSSGLGEDGQAATAELTSDLEAPVVGLHLLLRIAPGASLPALELRLGTTRGTNALLERKGARSALLVTKGFADLLEIGDQARPDIFALEIVRPAPLSVVTLEIEERVAANGEILVPLQLDSSQAGFDAVLNRLREDEIESVAVSLLHGYANPAHERAIAAALRNEGFHVSSGEELSGLAGYLVRTQTAVVDAYLAPILKSYIDKVCRHVGQPLRVMSSAGGLVQADRFRAKDSLLSGPAGGVMGCFAACRLAEIEAGLAFDMGGTSTDVSRIGNDVEYDEHHQVGGIVVAAPALAIRTVAAGGGSLCSAEGGRLAVGPESAGAEPGPACYGRGGPLTVTDVNVLLGRIDEQRFDVGLNVDASRVALREQQQHLDGISEEELLGGFLQIANERMAETIAEVSTRRGFDPKDHALVAFGGAGGQHACELAELLGISRVLVPADCSVLSARGIGAAAVERIEQEQLLLSPSDPNLEVRIRTAESQCQQRLLAEAGAAIETRQRVGCEVATTLSLRYRGQDSGLEIACEPLETAGQRFKDRYQEVFGTDIDREIEVNWLRTRARLPGSELPANGAPAAEGEGTERRPAEPTQIDVWSSGRWAKVAKVDRQLVPAAEEGRLRGPALISEQLSSTWLPKGWSAFTEDRGLGLVLELEPDE